MWFAEKHRKMRITALQSESQRRFSHCYTNDELFSAQESVMYAITADGVSGKPNIGCSNVRVLGRWKTKQALVKPSRYTKWKAEFPVYSVVSHSAVS